MEMSEYKPGDIVPRTSSLYRVVHDPPEEEEHLETFYCGEHFPSCPECRVKVRYVLLAKLRETHRFAHRVVKFDYRWSRRTKTRVNARLPGNHFDM
jgi:hypothetical protein